MKLKSLLHLTALAAALLPTALLAERDNNNPSARGTVYTMSNAVAGNSVLVYERAADGSLTAAGAVPTGGLGTGTGLGNQAALVLSSEGRWLFACNPGSDEISVFSVTPRGLVRTAKVPSGGRRPVSLTVRRNLVYVLNAGGAAGDSDNITGFTFAAGQLTPLAQSTRALSAAKTGPAQVAFTREGDVLVVTEKVTGVIDTYTVGDDGLVTDQQLFASPVPTPFGFAVGREGRIFVSEANGGAANASSVSSYSLSDEGDITAITSAVATHQSAACWVVLTRNERLAYASNTGSGTISGYRVSRTGALSLLQADGITATTGVANKPIDLALTRGSRFLYSLNSGDGSITGFRIADDGSLVAVPRVTGLPAGANGLAAE